MEDHAERIGQPVVEKGWTVVFGPGSGRTNYVAVQDVARLAARVLLEAPRNDTVWIGGPENLSAMEVVRTYERVTGRHARVYHVPIPVLRIVRRVARRLQPVIGRIVDAGLFMESGGQQIDMYDTLARYDLQLTRLEDFVRGRYGRPPESSPDREVA
jgi:uncharacterized protein YbjT (DUF2867 family)